MKVGYYNVRVLLCQSLVVEKVKQKTTFMRLGGESEEKNGVLASIVR